MVIVGTLVGAALFFFAGTMFPQTLKAGGTVGFDILTGCDHPKACNTAFTAKRLKWLFGQKKQ